MEVSAPADPSIEVVNLTPIGPSGVAGWPVPLLMSDYDELLAAIRRMTRGRLYYNPLRSRAI